MNQWVATWLRWLDHDKGLAPNTCKLYERTVLGLEKDLSRLARLENLSAADLRAWLHSKGGSASSYGNRVVALKSFYGYLAHRKVVKDDPAASLDVPKRDPSPRVPVRDLGEKLHLLNELDAKNDRRVGESADMATFLAQTGMRVADACGLLLKPPAPAEIRVSKRGRPDKIIELNGEARAALDRLGGRFGIGPRALQRRFEKADFHPDQLRHWYRVNLAQQELRDMKIERSVRGAETSLRDRTRSGDIAATSTDSRPVEWGGATREGIDSREGQFWIDLAGQLESMADLIRRRFAT